MVSRIQEQVFFIDQAFPGKVSHIVDAGIHSDGITGAGLDTESAENAAQFVNFIDQGVFFDGRVLMFCSNYGDAICGAACGAKHTGGAARAAIVSSGQAVLSAEAGGDRFDLFGVFDGTYTAGTGTMKQVREGVFQGDKEAFDDLDQIDFFVKAHFLVVFRSHCTLLTQKHECNPGNENIDQGKWKHDFPAEFHELIVAETGQCPACPDEAPAEEHNFQ